MNREEFLAALEQDLADVSAEERSEALKFYSEFLDEAGPEREADVIAELGEPHRVANIIRANMGLEGIAGVRARPAAEAEGPQPQPKDSGEKEPAAPRPELTLDGPDWAGTRQAQDTAGEAGRETAGGAASRGPGGPAYTGAAGSGHAYSGPAYTGYPGNQASRRSDNRVLWIILLVVTFPIWIGLAGGLLAMVFGLAGALLGIAGAGVGVICSGVFHAVRALVSLVGNPFGAMVDLGFGLIRVAVGCLMTGLGIWLIAKAVPFAVRLVSRIVRAIERKVGH